MNSLSLFLYAAETIGKIPVILGLVFTSCLLYMVIMCVRVFNWNWDNQIMIYTHKDRPNKEYKGFWRWPLIIICVTGVGFLFTPSTQTMYLIAGSEATEAVVTSQEGREILNDVKEVIRTQLNNLKK